MLTSIQSICITTHYQLPCFLSKISAGFPSPAEDYLENSLDLNEYLVKHPAATFMVRVKGDSMRDAGILDGNLLVVDRSIEPVPGKVVIAAVHGELTVKRLIKTKEGSLFLKAEHPDYPKIPISSDAIQLWGVVVHVINTL